MNILERKDRMKPLHTKEGRTGRAAPVDLFERKRRIRDAEARLAVLAPPDAATADELAQAGEIVAGQIRFNAAQPADIPRKRLSVGRRNIDWSGSHLHHQEWPTQLNRFFLLSPLRQAFEATGTPRFAEAARDYIADWIEQFDEDDITLRGNTCMDIGIRLGTHGRGGWCAAMAAFMDDPSWDDGFISDMLASIERQARILWKRGIPSRSWGNHRVFGLDGLLHTALRLPFIENAAAMRQYAVKGLEHAFRQQFLADGAHAERTLQYHAHMTGTFVYFARLGELVPEAAIDIPSERLLAAIDYMVHNLSGGINDNSAELADQPHTRDWDRAREWRAQLTGRAEPDWRPPRDAVFADAGQVFTRSAWDPGSDFLAFDAAPYACSHAHLARLGLVFRSGGRLWLADPGMFDYEMSNPFAVYGRSTRAHCTLNLDGLNQGTDDARLSRADLNDEVVFLHGIYTGGYWTGTYAWNFQEGFGQGVHGRHERMILWIRGEYLLVFDAVICDAGHTVESVWQMAPVAGWTHDPSELAWQTAGETPGFFLRMLMPPESVAMTIHEGERNPLRGWFASAYATEFTPAPQVVFRYPADSAFHITLAMPLANGRRPPTVTHEAFGADRGVTLTWPDGVVDCVALSRSLVARLDEDGPFETDSPLVWLRRDRDGRPARQFMLDGTFLRYRGDPP